MRLLLVRHAESQGNAENCFQGRDEYPLTERGLTQARRLAERLRREHEGVEAIYSSPQGRALQTAEYVAKALSAPVMRDPRLCERHIGVLTGLTLDEALERYPDWADAWRSADDAWPTVPGEECAEALACRVGQALDAYRQRHADGQTVVVVSHGGALGAMLCHLLGLTGTRRNPFVFGNASLSVVDVARGRVRLVGLNDTCHLNGDDHDNVGGSDD